MSLYTMLFFGSTPIGNLLFGFLAEHQGVQVAAGEVAILCGIGIVAGRLYIRSAHEGRHSRSGNRNAARRIM